MLSREVKKETFVQATLYFVLVVIFYLFIFFFSFAFLLIGGFKGFLFAPCKSILPFNRVLSSREAMKKSHICLFRCKNGGKHGVLAIYLMGNPELRGKKAK